MDLSEEVIAQPAAGKAMREVAAIAVAAICATGDNVQGVSNVVVVAQARVVGVFHTADGLWVQCQQVGLSSGHVVDANRDATAVVDDR